MGLSKLLVFLLAWGLSAASLAAQTRIVSVRIYPSVTGPQIMVDGKVYTGPAVLLWPEGSKHQINADVSQSGVRLNTIYTFKCWVSNLSGTCLDGGRRSVAVTADRDLTYIRA